MHEPGDDPRYVQILAELANSKAALDELLFLVHNMCHSEAAAAAEEKSRQIVQSLAQRASGPQDGQAG